MKTKNACILLLAALTMTACEYDDSALWEQVNQNTERIAALEAWQVETNTNIQSLQTLLNTADYITAVTPVTENEVEVGYTITFLNSDPVTIYNGEKGDTGETGATGAAGATPQIGVTQAEDGNWYWTLNGELLTDTEGNPIRANGEKGDKGDTGDTGAQGPQGEQGDKGDTGAEGATDTSAPVPQLKTGASLTNVTQDTQGDTIKPEAIYLSVDGGETWTRVSGEDGTDGTDGTNGKDGDSFFSKVDTSDPTCVIFTLKNSDGTTTSFSVPRYTGIKVDFGNTTEVYLDYGTTETVNFTAEGSESFTTDNLFIVAPDGWKATAAASTRASSPFTLTVTAPADATSGATEGDILVMLDNGQGSTTIGRLTVMVKYIIDGTTLTARGLEAGKLATAINTRTDLTSIIVTSGTLNETDWAAVVNNNAALLYLDLAGATYEGTDKDNLAYSYSRAKGLPLLTVQLPQGITALGEDAFYGCEALTSITLPEGLDSIGGDAFYNCYALESIDLPEGVTSIGNRAFDYCKALTSITLPEGVTSIGEFAFAVCTVLKSIDLPETLTSIGYGAFQACTSLTSIDLPEGLTTTGSYAFENCSALTSITLPETLTTIGNGAFSQCASLKSITLPDKVTSIGNFAFAYCTSLPSITLPDKVTSIGDFAFHYCSSLTTITCLATTPPTVSSMAFLGSDGLKTIYVPDGSEDDYKAASGWSDYSTKIQPIQ